jgi:hypothetical protein
MRRVSPIRPSVRSEAAMETECAALVGAAATTLVGAIATDTWESVKESFAHLLGCDNEERRTLAESRLDASAREITQAAEEVRGDARASVLSTWRTRLIDFLQEEPQDADALRALVKKYAASRSYILSSSGNITQHNRDGNNVANTGTIGNVSFGRSSV